MNNRIILWNKSQITRKKLIPWHGTIMTIKYMHQYIFFPRMNECLWNNQKSKSEMDNKRLIADNPKYNSL